MSWLFEVADHMTFERDFERFEFIDITNHTTLSSHEQRQQLCTKPFGFLVE